MTINDFLRALLAVIYAMSPYLLLGFLIGHTTCVCAENILFAVSLT